MDHIHIRDLALRCIIGIFPEERKHKQDVVLNLRLDCEPFHAAAASDDIEDAVNYKTITKRIIALFVEPSEYQLIETLADRVAHLCLEDPRVLRAHVTVDKPGALRFARSVAVEVVRSRDQ